MTLFPNKVTFQILRIKYSTYLFWRQDSTHDMEPLGKYAIVEVAQSYLHRK